MSQDIGFLKPLESAVALCDSFSLIVIKTAEDYTEAEAKRKQAREFKAALLLAYNAHPIVIAGKEIQAQKKALEDRLEAFNKDVKSGPMLKYEQEQERIAQAEENRLAEIARAEQAKETARLVAEQKKAFEVAEKARKAAEKKGDDEAAARASMAAEQARIAAQNIKTDAAMAQDPVVVLERTSPKVSRRKIYKYRLTTKDGRKFLKGEIGPLDRLKIGDFPQGSIPLHLFALSPVLLNEFVDSQGESCAVTGILEVKSEMV